MRIEVMMPDQIYTDAQRIAAETGVTLDSLVSDAVKVHIDETYDEPKVTRLG